MGRSHYVAFDAPGLDDVFESRLDVIRAQIELSYLIARELVACIGLDHLHAEFARKKALGREGLMLLHPRSCYEVGRSRTLLKFKSFCDAESRVLEHLQGAGQ